jgi:hypothetical protein
MATTTNFGWETPDDTDLVKDGAAAIRTALGGVDTSFVDLKGGTTGQVLAKASNTDLDYSWTTLTAASGPAFKAFLASNSSTLTNGAFTKVAFGSELFDTDNCFDSTTNYRFTPTKAGYYQLSATAEFGGQTLRTFVTLYRNGTRYSDLAVVDGGYGTTLSGSDLIYFNGSTDYAEVYVYVNSSSVAVQGQASPGYRTHFAGVWIRS